MSLAALLAGVVAGEGFAGPSMARRTAPVVPVPIYAFDNGWSWQRLTSDEQVEDLEGEERGFGYFVMLSEHALGGFSQRPTFALVDPNGATQAVIVLDRERDYGHRTQKGLWFIQVLRTFRGLDIFVTDPATGKVDINALTTRSATIHSAVYTFVFDWLGLSPDATPALVRSKLDTVYVVPDMGVFDAIDHAAFEDSIDVALQAVRRRYPDPYHTEARRRDPYISLTPERIVWPQDFDFGLRGYIDKVVSLLNRGLDTIEVTERGALLGKKEAYYSPSSLRTEDDWSWIWRWSGVDGRVELVTTFSIDPSTGLPTHTVEQAHKHGSANTIVGALLDAGLLITESDWDALIEANRLPGRPLVELEAYELLGTAPPPLMPLSAFRAWAGQPADD